MYIKKVTSGKVSTTLDSSKVYLAWTYLCYLLLDFNVLTLTERTLDLILLDDLERHYLFWWEHAVCYIDMDHFIFLLIGNKTNSRCNIYFKLQLLCLSFPFYIFYIIRSIVLYCEGLGLGLDYNLKNLKNVFYRLGARIWYMLATSIYIVQSNIVKHCYCLFDQ